MKRILLHHPRRLSRHGSFLNQERSESSQSLARQMSMKVFKHIRGKKKEVDGRDSSPRVKQETRVFGVPLDVAVQRSMCPDHLLVPRIVRECILHVEGHGLQVEGIYRLSGMKSHIDQLRLAYNDGQVVSLTDVDVHAVAGLLKQYLRELPTHILTSKLSSNFDNLLALKTEQEQLAYCRDLLRELPPVNRTTLQWIVTHIYHINQMEAFNKMSLQNLCIVFSPSMNVRNGLLFLMIKNCVELFGEVNLVPYQEDTGGDPCSTVLQRSSSDAGRRWCEDDVLSLQEALVMKEQYLSQLDGRLTSGLKGGQEYEELMNAIWEVQRDVTTLKRTLKMSRFALAHSTEVSSSSLDGKRDQAPPPDQSMQVDICSAVDQDLAGTPGEESATSWAQGDAVADTDTSTQDIPPVVMTTGSAPSSDCKAVPDLEDVIQHQYLSRENKELLRLQSYLQQRVENEKSCITRLQAEIDDLSERSRSTSHDDGMDSPSDSDSDNCEEEQQVLFESLVAENRDLVTKTAELTMQMVEERVAVASLLARIDNLDASSNSNYTYTTLV